MYNLKKKLFEEIMIYYIIYIMNDIELYIISLFYAGLH